MSAQPVNAANTEHYSWGEGCDGWYLVRTEDLTVIEEQMPPGASEKAHRHALARQFFFVLSGELTLVVEGAAHTLGSGYGLEIAPREVHQAVNRGSHAVRFVVTSQPSSHKDRIDV